LRLASDALVDPSRRHSARPGGDPPGGGERLGRGVGPIWVEIVRERVTAWGIDAVPFEPRWPHPSPLVWLTIGSAVRAHR
jgi:hypothetical protein